MVHEFDGTKHGKPRDMQAARRAKYLDLVRGGMNLAQAARAVGVCVCSIGSGPVEHLELVHVSGWF